MLILILSAVAGAGATAAWMLDQRRCRRRNEGGRCGACGVSWTETAPGDPYVIHGRLVCEDCAEKARRRMPWEFSSLAAFTAVAAGSAMGSEGSAVALVLFVAGSTTAMTVGSVQMMKLANRKAQLRIAKGESPEFAALRSVEGTALDPARHEDPAAQPMVAPPPGS